MALVLSPSHGTVFNLNFKLNKLSLSLSLYWVLLIQKGGRYTHHEVESAEQGVLVPDMFIQEKLVRSVEDPLKYYLLGQKYDRVTCVSVIEACLMKGLL